MVWPWPVLWNRETWESCTWLLKVVTQVDWVMEKAFGPLAFTAGVGMQCCSCTRHWSGHICSTARSSGRLAENQNASKLERLQKRFTDMLLGLGGLSSEMWVGWVIIPRSAEAAGDHTERYIK